MAGVEGRLLLEGGGLVWMPAFSFLSAGVGGGVRRSGHLHEGPGGEPAWPQGETLSPSPFTEHELFPVQWGALISLISFGHLGEECVGEAQRSS